MPPGLLQWASPTAGGLLALFVILVAIGWLVPLRTVKRELDEKDRLAEMHAARADKLADLLSELMPYARNVDELLKELRRRMDREAGS